MSSNNFSPLATHAAPLSAIQPGIGSLSAVPNSASLSIPAPTQTAFHKAGGDSDAEPKGQKGRRRGIGWLKPHARVRPARESLMLATPSFVALNISNSTASFASRYSPWHGRRGWGKADTGVAASDSAAPPASIQPGSEAFPVRPSLEERNLPWGSSHLFASLPAVLVTPSSDEPLDGLPKDMLETLSELEVVAEEIKKLPTPEAPERPPNPVGASAVPASSGSDGSCGPTLPEKHSKGASSEKACVAIPTTASVSKLPRTCRIVLGGTLSSRSSASGTPARSAIPFPPRRTFSEQAEKPEGTPITTPLPTKTCSNLPANPLSKVPTASTPKTPVAATLRLKLKTAPGLAARSSNTVIRKPSVSFGATVGRGATPVTSGAGERVVSNPARIAKMPGLGSGTSKLKTAVKPRLSEPIAATSSSLRKVSPTVSGIARKARHSALPRVG
ncbi:hypothetical protein FOMPIDRAFT_110451 [Fomitopsis schrenkii]|uniref:Uncharacterized protein n=1 Tax=Fomitopsis schrenkii TaxID=2126942 RepID=S8F862_FOMSC|nr:hypothetical protein FOMPIDRAFT_110451 [Fomitopsis schrenkii]